MFCSVSFLFYAHRAEPMRSLKKATLYGSWSDIRILFFLKYMMGNIIEGNTVRYLGQWLLLCAIGFTTPLLKETLNGKMRNVQHRPLATSE